MAYLIEILAAKRGPRRSQGVWGPMGTVAAAMPSHNVSPSQESIVLQLSPALVYDPNKRGWFTPFVWLLKGNRRTFWRVPPKTHPTS